MNLQQLTECYIKKNMMINDRDCFVKDPTADVLDVVEVVDKRLKRAWNTEKIHLKILTEVNKNYDAERALRDEEYEEEPFQKRYLYEIDKIYEGYCPPKEIEVLLQWTYHHNLDAWFAFLWFCERQAKKNAAAARAARYAAAARAASYAAAARAASYAAADYARAASYAAAARAARYAAAARAAAEIAQIEFLRWCLGVNQP